MAKQLQCKQCGRKFKPIHPKQVDCSEICLCNRFDTLVRKSRKIARLYALTMGYRSMAEVRFASRMRDANIKFKYEAKTFEYRYDIQKYIVDFSISDNIHLEFKGKLDVQARRKMLAVKKCNPTADIRLVFEKPNNKLYKGSKTTYWEWAEKHGFPWYDCMKDMDKIRKDLNDARKKSKRPKKAIRI